jgi:hypothetical protein
MILFLFFFYGSFYIVDNILVTIKDEKCTYIKKIDGSSRHLCVEMCPMH